MKLKRANTSLEEQLKAKEQELADIKNTTENLKKAIDEKGKELDDMRKKTEEREQILQADMKQLKKMFEQELLKLRKELNVGVFAFDTTTFDFTIDDNFGEYGLGGNNSNQGINTG